MSETEKVAVVWTSGKRERGGSFENGGGRRQLKDHEDEEEQ